MKAKHKAEKSGSPSSSESSLVTLLSSASLSRTSSRWSQKTKAPTLTSPESRVFPILNTKKNVQGEKKEEKVNVDSTQNEGQVGKLGDLPFDPVFRAGILIIVTSPKGRVSLGVCDGESPVKPEERAMGTSSRSSGRLKRT